LDIGWGAGVDGAAGVPVKVVDMVALRICNKTEIGVQQNVAAPS
jgi:hypothetical protein